VEPHEKNYFLQEKEREGLAGLAVEKNNKYLSWKKGRNQ